MPEVWLPVVEFPDYQVSDHGTLRNARSGRALTAGAHSKAKYVYVALRRDGGTWARTAHVLVLEAFVGPSNGRHGLHYDDDGRHNHLGNLRWGTPAENAVDRYRNGGAHWNSLKTHCPLDHELIPVNLTAASVRKGGRACLACSRARTQVRNAAQRGVVLDLRTESDRHYADILAGVAHPHARDRTHCPWDHQLAAPNLIAAFERAGRRGCLACHRARGYVAHYPDADLRTEADRYYAAILAAA